MRAIYLIFGLLLLSQSALATDFSSWTYYRQTLIKTATVGVNASQSNFQVLVRLNNSNFDFTQAMTNGEDARFQNSSGTDLNFEIERWDSGSELAEIWVEVPSVIGNNDTQYITMFWGKPGSSSGSNSENTFATADNFIGVWHLGEDGNNNAGNYQDATANNLNGTGSSMSTASDVSAAIGIGSTFDGSSDQIDITTGTMPNIGAGNYTLTAWIKTASTAGYKTIFASNNYDPAFYHDSNRLLIYDGSDTGPSTLSANDDNWHHVAFVRAGLASGDLAFYIDGAPVGTTQHDDTVPVATTLRIAWDSFGGDNWDGELDEIRYANTNRSADWVKLAYEAQKPNSTLLEHGATNVAGGVMANLTLWLKADGGTSCTTNNCTVSSWSDQANSNNGTAGGDPRLTTNALNFNPLITFDGAGDWFVTPLSVNSDTNPDLAVISVYIPRIDLSGALWGEDNEGFDRWQSDFTTASCTDAVTNGNCSSNNNIPNLFDVGQANLNVVIFDEDVASGSSVYVKGKNERSFTSNHGPQVSNTFSIGQLGKNDFPYDGQIAEMIVVSQLLNGGTDRLQIESYLAIKYGITLDSGVNDYVDSSGASVFNLDGTYESNVVGIGQDDGSELNQRVSRSANSDAIVTLANNQDFVSANNDPGRVSLGDGNYLMMGHNGNDTALTSSHDGTPNTRMNRVWRVEETGTVGSIYIAVPNTTSLGASPAVVVSNDAVFDSSDSVIALTDDGSYYWALINPADGQFISFADANVMANLSLWLKADSGTDTTVESADVDTWTDQSANAYPAIEADNGHRPTYGNNVLNFNPALNYGAGSDFIGFNLGANYIFSPAANNGMHIFAVAFPDNSGGNRFLYDFGNLSPLNVSLALSTTEIGAFQSAVGTTSSISVATTVLAEHELNFGGNASLYLNGESLTSTPMTWTEITTNEIAENPTSAGSSGPVTIGRQSKSGVLAANDRRFFGDIGEMIVFNKALSDDEDRQVRSYLAIKYGITLDSGVNDYVDSSGASVFNLDGTYESNVVGIGQDDGSELNQRVSRSANSDAIVTLANNQDFVSANNDPGRVSLGDGNYLMMGHNGNDTALTSSHDGTPNTRMNRVWRVEETGTVGSIYIAVPNTTSLGASPAVVVSNDAVFDSSDSVIALTDDGSYYWALINPADGQFISFADAPPPALIAEYKFEEAAWSGAAGEVLDSSGLGNHGTGLGAAQPVNDGRVCRGMNVPYSGSSFATTDGFNTGLDVDSDIGNQGSISFWFNSNRAYSDNDRWILADASTTSSVPAPRYFYLAKDTDNTMLFAYLDSGGFGSVAKTGVLTIAANVWTHITVTWDVSGGTSVSNLYLDGVLQATTTKATTVLLDGLETLSFGDKITDYPNTYHTAADGIMDEVRIYNYAQTPAEITTDMSVTNSCQPLTPIAYFPLDQSGDTWNGTPGEVIDETGNFTSALALNTGDGVEVAPGQVCAGIEIPNTADFSTTHAMESGIDLDADVGNRGTISFWYKSERAWVGGFHRRLFDASAVDKYFYLVLTHQGTIRMAFEDDVDFDVGMYTPVNSIAADTWVFITVTWDLLVDRRQIYIDGVLASSESTATSGNLSADYTSIHFGDTPGNSTGAYGNSAGGVIDEIRIYDDVQRESEIIADMDARHGCLVAHYQFESPAWSGTAGEVLDSSGLGNHGTGLGAAQPVIDGRDCRGMDVPYSGSSFVTTDGFNTGLDVDSDIGNQGSISFWFNSNRAYSDNDRWILADASTTSSVPAPRYFYLAKDTDNTMLFAYLDSGGFGSVAKTGVLTIAANVWTHITVTWDVSGGTSVSNLYLDGVLQATTTKATTVLLDGLETLSFGDKITDFPNTYHTAADGIMDEVRIYDVAQTAAEIMADMNARRGCGLVANLGFDEVSWSGTAGEVIDSSGYGNHGVAVNSSRPVAGLVCNAAEFNGTNHVLVANSTELEVGKDGADYTVNFWVKLDPTQLSDYRTLSRKGTDNTDRTFAAWLRSGEYNGVLQVVSTTAHWNENYYPTPVIGLNVWTMVTLVKSGTQLETYFDGSMADSLTLTGTSIHNTGPIYIGKDPFYDGMRGLIDEYLIFDDALSVDEIQSIHSNNLAGNRWDGGAVSCTPSLDHFEVSAAASASTCLAHAVTISARDASNNLVPSYSGVVDISTSTGHGNWAVNTATNPTVPSPHTSDNGNVDYSFDVADAGDIVLDLSNSHAEALTITVNDVGVDVNGTSGNITFGDNVLVISEDPIQVAGRPQAMNLALWKSDPGTGNCGIDTNYASNAQGLKVSVDRGGVLAGASEPTINGVAIPSAPPGFDNLTLDFSATPGQHDFSLVTTDVGQYTVTITDDSLSHSDQAITGTSTQLTVRPFGLAVTDIQAGATVNPSGSAATSAIFTAAGADFEATVAGVLWASADDANNDGVLDSGRSYNDNSVTPSYAWDTPLSASAGGFTPATGTVGTLSNGSQLEASFSSGEANPTNLQYDEVGSFTLQASATSYLGEVSADLASDDIIVGRFVPDRFDLSVVNNGTFESACTSSTYMGQSFGYGSGAHPQVAISALNVQGNVTQNYRDAFEKLDASSMTVTVTQDDGTSGSDAGPLLVAYGAASMSYISQNNGVLAYTLGSDSYRYGLTAPAAGTSKAANSQVSPFNSDINPEITEVADGEVTTAYVAGTHRLDPAAISINFGRLRMTNAHGSEIAPLSMPAIVEHWNGTSFVASLTDNCTSIEATDLNLVSSLSGGSSITTIDHNPAVAGEIDLSFSAPGSGINGYIDAISQLDVANHLWLRWDWDQDGEFDDDPSARASFGIYQGNQRQIYRQQIFQ